MIIYQVGHFGYISKFLIHKYIHHPNDDVLFLIDISGFSKEALGFVFSQKLSNHVKYYCYSENQFYVKDPINILEKKVNDFFDMLLSYLRIDPYKVDAFYLGMDERGAFCTYLCHLGINYILFEQGHGLLRGDAAYQSNDPNKQSYRELLKKYRATTKDSQNCTKIICDPDKVGIYEPTPSEEIDYIKSIEKMPADVIEKLKLLYPIKYDANSSYTALLMRNNIFLKSSTCAKMPGIDDDHRYLYIYSLLLDYCNCSKNTTLLKAHPVHELSKELRKNYLNGYPYMGGNVPFELIGLYKNLKISKILSIGTSASKYVSKNTKVVEISSEYFRVYPSIHRIQAAISILKERGCTNIYINSSFWRNKLQSLLHEMNPDISFSKSSKTADSLIFDSDGDNIPPKTQLPLVICSDKTIEQELISNRFKNDMIFELRKKSRTLKGLDLIGDIDCVDYLYIENLTGPIRYSKQLQIIKAEIEIVPLGTKTIHKTPNTYQRLHDLSSKNLSNEDLLSELTNLPCYDNNYSFQKAKMIQRIGTPAAVMTYKNIIYANAVLGHIESIRELTDQLLSTPNNTDPQQIQVLFRILSKEGYIYFDKIADYNRITQSTNIRDITKNYVQSYFLGNNNALTKLELLYKTKYKSTPDILQLLTWGRDPN